MKTITEKNKVIAKFMGGIEKYEGIRFPLNIEAPKEAGGDEIPYLELSQLKYHSSWDWLMPVVKKIFDIWNGRQEVTENQEDAYCDINSGLADIDIKKTHIAVYKFITK